MIRRPRRLRSSHRFDPAGSASTAGPVQGAARATLETLERRTLLCVMHQSEPPVELPFVPTDSAGAEAAADIVWVNRGQSSDGFTSTFGSGAETARRVMDAVIESFERMIGSFNYGDGSSNFNLTVQMSGNHNGASAGLSTTVGGKPKSGTITMGKGGDGFGSGWFIDPTPHEHSEFQGSIVNAYSGNAHSGSPASGRGDFFTVAAAEITHVLGLFGSRLPLWSSKTTNTGVADTAEGGGRGTFYVFNGPSIKHLLTSNNGGSGGQDFGSAVHGAGPGVTVNFGGESYIGAQDIGNAVYEFSRRYIPSNTFALMFKDAFGYSTVNPDQFGTFYANLHSTSGQVLVRGGSSLSHDTIDLSVSGNTLTVSVDVGNDIPGTGHLAGQGDLPAFVSQFDLSQVNSILIQSGDGNDIINIDGLPASVNTTVQGGVGSDTINVNHLPAGATLVLQPGSNNDTVKLGSGDLVNDLLGNLTYNGEAGIDTLVFDDSATSLDTQYTLSSTTFAMTGRAPIDFSGLSFEAFSILTGSGNNAIDVASVQSAIVRAGAGDDVIRIGGSGSYNLDGDDGSDTITLDDSAATAADVYTVTASSIARAGLSVSYTKAESIELLAGSGNNTIDVNSTPPAFTLRIDAGAGTDTVNVNETDASSVVLIDASAGADHVNVNTDGTATARVRFESTLTELASLSIGSGGAATLAAEGAARTLVTADLAISGTGQLDLGDGALVWNYTGASPLATLQALLSNGYAGGAWNGTGGINSSDLESNESIGYAEASDLFSAFPGIFAGQEVDSTSLLVRSTLDGDANLDGTVNLSDFNRVAGNFGTTGTAWSQGNFNYDNNTNLADFNALAANFGLSVTDDDLATGMLSAAPAATSTGSSTIVETGAKKRRK